MRIACLSDVHGNYYAFEKALRLVNIMDVDKVIFLGDALGYFPSLNPLEILSEKPDIQCIKGNHEEMILSGHINEKHDDVYRHSQIIENLGNEEKQYISSWEDFIVLGDSGFFHGGPLDYLNQRIYPNSDLRITAEHTRENYANLKVCVMAHTHRPFIREYEGILWVNCGSVGMPRDVGNYGAFAIIDTAVHKAEIIRFDIAKCLDQMIKKHPETHEHVVRLSQRESHEKPYGTIINE